MPRYGLHDPNTVRHHIVLLMAMVAQRGDDVVIPYGELGAVAARGVELEFHNDLVNREVRIRLVDNEAAKQALAQLDGPTAANVRMLTGFDVAELESLEDLPDERRS